MAFAQTGMPTPAAIRTAMDALGSWFKAAWSPVGVGQDTETSSLAYYARLAETKILGDGSSTYPGVDNADLQQRLRRNLSDFRRGSRADILTQVQLGPMARLLESFISENLPRYVESGTEKRWNFSSAGLHALDAFLIRLNATHASTPTKPTGTPTLTAATGGAIPTCTSGNGPRFVYSWVGAYDHLESQPSAVATQVALSGDKNAYTVGAIQNPVPTGATKIRLYRGLVGGGAGVWHWIRDQAVTAGQAPPTVTLTEADIALRQDIAPPSWAQALMMPEEAALFALAFAILKQEPGAASGLVSLISSAMLNPASVVFNPVYVLAATPSYEFQGIANPPSSAEFGRWTSASYVAGTLRTLNDAANGLQGCVGGYGIQARTVSALNANASMTNIGYTYVDAANPITPQSDTVAGPVVLNSALDSTVDLGITAGRIVKSITGVTVGGATTGAFIFEAKRLRTL